MRALTASVVDHALEEIAERRREGYDLSVAVNLGPADLLDVGLPSEIERLLRRRGFPPDRLRLEVRDNGVGIPSRNLADIFKPFHRIDRTRAEGLGLGLFIVKCAAAFLGHGIEVYSAPGRGSRFVVALNGAPAVLQPPQLNANSFSRDWGLTHLR